jgi:hypothetical protein
MNDACLTVLTVKAARLVAFRQTASLSTLQARFKLGYRHACQIMERLEQAGVVIRLPRHVFGHWSIAPNHVTRHKRNFTLDLRRLYVDKLVELVLFFFEMHEEDNAGDTRAIGYLKPAVVDNLALRTQVLEHCFQRDQLGFTETALTLHRWLLAQDKVPVTARDVETAIRTACQPFERTPRNVVDLPEKRSRAFIRLARYYLLMHKHGTAIHNSSRAAEAFVPEAWFRPFADRALYREHVVPCAYMRNKAIELFGQDWSAHDVAKLLERWLLILDIPEADGTRLDSGPHALKHIMPKNWDPIHGCIFQRFHDLRVPFDVPPGWSCSH